MSIRHKLLLVFLTSGVAGVLIAGVLGYQSGKRSLTQTVMNQLTGVRRSKAYQIETYFRTLRSHIRTLSENRMMVDAMQEFAAEFRKLNGPPVPPASRVAVQAYYRDVYLPSLHRLMPQHDRPEELLPVTNGAYYLQEKYIVSNPEPLGRKRRLENAGDSGPYTRVHAPEHRSLLRLIEEFGYYDFFFITAEYGEIVYTVQ